NAGGGAAPARSQRPFRRRAREVRARVSSDTSRSFAETNAQDMHWLLERVQPNVVVRSPGEFLFGDQVGDLERGIRFESQAGEVKVHGRLTYRVRVDVGNNDDGVTAPAADVASVELFAVDEDRRVVAPVHIEVAQLAKRRMLETDAVQLFQVRSQRLARSLCRGVIPGAVLVFLVVDVLFA